MLSSNYLLPQLIKIQVGGRQRSALELKSYQQKLVADILNLENKRADFVTPLHNSVYSRLLSAKENQYHPLTIKEAVDSLAKESDNAQPVIHINQFQISYQTGQVQLAGEVKNVGPRCMTVLAQFAEELKKMPFVIGVSQPDFIRREDAGGNFYSPFNINLEINSSLSK